MNLNSILLRLIARSSDSLVAFVIALDAKIDKFLAQHDSTVANLEDQIGDIFENAEDEIIRVRAEADKATAAIRDKIVTAQEQADVLARLKSVLTK